jgi:hypothetical protein
MPRGSKPGERRGGRQRGTPNKKTLLRNAAVNAAAADPNISPLGFLLGLMRDVSLPIALRVDMAAAALPVFHAKPKAPRRVQHAGKQTWTLFEDVDGRVGPGGDKGKIKLVAKPKPSASDGAPGSTISPLEFLLNVMSDPATLPELRIKAARIAAPYWHKRPTTVEPVIDGDSVTTDEYGFVVEQAFAKKLRDLVIKECVSFYNRTHERRIRDEIDELCKLLPDCPSGYDQAGADADRLEEYRIQRLEQRESLRLSAEQDAEEAHVIFRLRTYQKASKKTDKGSPEVQSLIEQLQSFLPGDRDEYEGEAESYRVLMSYKLYDRERGMMR